MIIKPTDFRIKNIFQILIIFLHSPEKKKDSQTQALRKNVTEISYANETCHICPLLLETF